MFVAIYRWRLHPGLEQDFIVNWQRITTLGRAAGSGGSSLFKDADGCWVAIARWPSQDARDQFFEQLRSEGADPAMQERARSAVAESFPAQELQQVIDDWAPAASHAEDSQQ
ncbi:MAG: antibiotic biosynthesis monooxygenase [Rhodanobacter sp.]